MNARTLIKSLALLALFASLGMTTRAVAQEAAAVPEAKKDEVEKMEKFVVTGSNITMASEQLAIPVMVIGQDQIATSGEATNTLDLLRKIAPSISGIGVENATISTATNYGGSEINVHGLAVLVMINGHRVATDSAEAVGGHRFSDLNMVPTSAIDHIEVLQDGASAIYGSEAVGGVINVILKKDYNGWEAGAHYGRSSNDGHYSERSFSLTGGVSDGKTSITVSAEYAQHDPIFFSQRPYTNPYYANDYIPGVIDIYSLATGVDEIYTLNPKYNAPPGGGLYSIDQLVAMGYYIDQGDASNPATDAKVIPPILNFAAHQTLISSLKRHSFVTNVTHKIFNDNLEFFADLQYSRTQTVTTLNAQPIYPYISTPYTDAWYNGGPPTSDTQYVPVTIPGNPFSQSYIDQGADGSAGFGVDAHARLVDYPRIFRNDSTLFNVAGGLRGNINSNYSWEASGLLSRYNLDYANQNVIDATNFYAALQQGVLNPFAIKQADGVLPGNILGTATMNGLSTLTQGNFILRGTPYELPAGSLSFALGFTYSRETLSAEADLNTTDKGWINSPSILPINQSRSNEAYFAEVAVPIFGKGYRIPGFYSLTADLAGRIENYEKVGQSKVPKFSLKYEPVNDEFSVRFSAGKSFVAPTMYSLYGPVNVGSSDDIVYTPYGSTTALPPTQFEAKTGSNPDLQPSTATTWTAGFGFTPAALKGFTLTFDYFQTHQVGLPDSYNEQTMIQSVENLGTASPYASYIHFGSVNGIPVTAPGQISGHPKNAVWIFDPTFNLGGTWTKGFDVTADYVVPVKTYGKFDLRSTATVYNTYTLQQVPTEPYYSYLGATSQKLGTIPNWKTYSTIDWTYKGWNATVNHLYVPSVGDIGSGGASANAPVHVSSYSQFDLTVAYAFKNAHLGRFLEGLTLRLGMNNVFNAMPPVALLAQTETNADVGFYGGAVGRELYVDATYKF
jgi:iron complex outermembrane receptor protein